MGKLHKAICARDIEPNRDAADVICAAKEVISLVAGSSIRIQYQRHIIDSMLWRIAIAPFRHKRKLKKLDKENGEFLEGDKTACRYCTKEALAILQSGSSKDVQHEHVFGKKWLIKRILELAKQKDANGRISDFIDQNVIACCVTKDEHKRLVSNPEAGWTRYKEAKGGPIEVSDRRQSDPNHPSR